MTNRRERILSRLRIERKYEELGLTDYKLRTLEQLKEIHGVDVNQISGYQDLPEEQKTLFDKAVINFYNARGLDNRRSLLPKSVNYVYDIDYYSPINEHESDHVGTEVYVLDKDSRSVKRRLHRYTFIKGIKFKECEKVTSRAYIRFELKSEWYHILSPIEWY